MELGSKLNKIINEFEEGNINSLDALLQVREIAIEVKDVQDNLKQFEDYIQEYVANDCQDYKEGYKGKKISVMNGRKIYDWSCVPEVLQLEANLKAKKKEYEVIFNSGVGIEKRGEVYFYGDKPMPILNYGKSFIKVENIK